MKEPPEIFFAKYVINKSLKKDERYYTGRSKKLIDEACTFLENGADGPNLRILAGSHPEVLDNDSGLVYYLVRQIDEEVKYLLPTLEAASKCCLIYYFKAYLAGNIDEDSVMKLVFEVGQNLSSLDIITTFLPLKYILQYYDMVREEEFVYEPSQMDEDQLIHYIFYYISPSEKKLSGFETIEQFKNVLDNYDTFEKLQKAIKTKIENTLQKLSVI